MLKLQKMIARTRGSGAKCKICGKTFEDKAALFYHRLSNHADTTDAHFQCHRCLKMFHFESHLREHLVNHRGIQNWLKCPEMDCGRFLQSEFHLTQHMISHSGKNIVVLISGVKFNYSIFCSRCSPLRVLVHERLQVFSQSQSASKPFAPRGGQSFPSQLPS